MARDLPFRVRFTAVDKLSSSIDKVTGKFPKLTKSVRRTSNAFKILQAKTERVRKNLKSVGDSMTSMGTKMSIGLTAPIVGFGVAAFNATANFQKSMNKVEALTGATGDELKKMSDQARLLGSTTAFSASQAADAMSFLGMAGFETNEILSATPGLLDLAAASGIELARAADIASNVMGAFKIEAKDTGMVADVLAKTTASSNVNMEQLAEAMKLAAPVAKAAGMSIQETSAAIGLLGNIGIQGSMAGTSLKNTMLGLAAPTSRASKIFKKLGIETTDSSGNIRKFSDLMGDFGKEISSLPQATQLKVLKEVFGKVSLAGATEFTKLATTIKDGKNEISLFTEKIEEADGAAKKMADTMLKGLPGAMVRLKSATEGLLLKFGIEGGLAGLAEKVIGKMTELVQWITTLNPTLLKWTAILAGLVAIIGPLILSLGLIIGFLPSMITGFGLVISVFAGFAKLIPIITFGLKLIAGGIALLLSPIGLVTAAVAGLINLFLRFDKIKAGFKKGVFTGIKTFFGFGPDNLDSGGVASGAPAGADSIIKKESEERKFRETNARVSVDFSNLPKGAKTSVEGDTNAMDFKLGMA